MNQRDKSLSYGLNARGRNKSTLKAFHDDDDDSVSSSEYNKKDSGSRHGVNKDLHKEQLALRKRAEERLHTKNQNVDSHIFDYDDDYESFSSMRRHENPTAHKHDTNTINNNNNNTFEKKKESRYISNLLHHAKIRQQEQEIVRERKIAKEQAEEELTGEYQGKERFITNAFKRKLQERDEWLKKDQEQSQREEKEDVTKKKASEHVFFAAGLYSNLQSSQTKERPTTILKNPQTRYDTNHLDPSSSITTNPVETTTRNYSIQDNTHFKVEIDPENNNLSSSSTPVMMDHDEGISTMIPRKESMTTRSERIYKVLQARKRYFIRRKEELLI